jgi:glucosamine kinase
MTPMTQAELNSPAPELGLGIDAGGSRTRWALAGADGVIVGSGFVDGMSALQMASQQGRLALQERLARLCHTVLALGRPCRVRAGLTGFDPERHGAQFGAWLSALLAIDVDRIVLGTDIDIAYLDSVGANPGCNLGSSLGRAYMVYAGTGSIGAWFDGDGQLQRAGGRGFLLDDGGGGYWIAREALRLIWRSEDERPGSWRTSTLAQAVFEQIGGSDWAASRQFMYEKQRGDIGMLALAVAATFDTDAGSAAILREAGRELARLALALSERHGPRPVVLTGRAAGLHPAIFDAMRAALPANTILTRHVAEPHLTAARSAAAVSPR